MSQGTRITGPVPPHLIELMDEKTRAELGLRNRSEIQADTAAESEKELQRLIGQYLQQRGIEFNVSAMHKRKTDKVGWPDITLGFRPPGFPYAIAVAFEAKLPGNFPQTQIKCAS